LAVPPSFSLFYDYEFRNWQAVELLEEVLWEDISPLSSLYELYENLIPSDLQIDVSKEDRGY
jgi:hypothetical protein